MADYGGVGGGDLLRAALAQQQANGGRVGVTMNPITASTGVPANQLIPAVPPPQGGGTTQGPMPQTQNGQATPVIRPGSPLDQLQQGGRQFGTQLMNTFFGGGAPSGYGPTSSQLTPDAAPLIFMPGG